MTSSTTVAGDTTDDGGTPAAESDKPTDADRPADARKLAETDRPAEKRSPRRGFAVRRGRRWRDSSISVKTLAVATSVLAATATIGALGWQLHDKAAVLDRLNRQAADSAHAESVASDYATGAAAMDFHDLAALGSCAGWRYRAGSPLAAISTTSSTASLHKPAAASARREWQRPAPTPSFATSRQVMAP
ncbi:hypothetical protein [Nocardia veterana]|uniref:Uncharacterized protein n=1 Tax=Nocardia veterana TaxID=132249 RepID=A0A7X6M3Q8_9NOCA|nr:hypothetical protein [Nocardia veterana]NKY89818.1 hypothetical protein [Nocardia veterana]